MQTNVTEYLERDALQRFKDKTAIIDGDFSITFAELDRDARICAQAINDHIKQYNRPIAVFLPKCAHTVVANLGILFSGNIYTNLDVKSAPQRLKKIITNVDPILFITNSALREILLKLEVDENRIIDLDAVINPTLIAEPGSYRLHINKVLDTDPMCIINTSGSTGIPKSVVLNHRSTIDFIDWVTERFKFTSTDVIGSLSPFYFDIYTLELFVSLAKGCTIVIIPEQFAAFPAKMMEFLAAKGVTFIFWVPTIMVNIANMDLLKSADLSKLRTVFFAGEVFPTKHLNYWRRSLPHALFVNLYGPIEITVDCTYFELNREFRDDEPIPIGIPCSNTDILILNEENQLTKPNEIGELCVRGTSLALGYWNNAEQTAKAFVQNPLNTRYPEIIYRTGDLAYWNDREEIMFVGRKDFQIKHLGYRIELGEIETAVLSLPEIAHACVLYYWEKKEITLFYEVKTPITPAILRRSLTEKISKYMLPTVYRQLDSMPRNPNGKIDRQALALVLKENS